MAAAFTKHVGKTQSVVAIDADVIAFGISAGVRMANLWVTHFVQSNVCSVPYRLGSQRSCRDASPV